jgi:hypothetical protein
MPPPEPAVDRERSARLLAMASEVLALDRRIAALHARRVELWSRFARDAASAPARASEACTRELQALRRALVVSEPPDAHAIDTGWGGIDEV